jgi:uncharacterized membrane protein
MDFSWIGLTFLGIFFWSCSTIVDKENLVKNIRNPFVAVAVNGCVDLTLAFIVLALFGVQLNSIFSVASFIAGLMVIGIYSFYYRTIKKESVAAYIAIMSVSPVFVVLLQFIFLKMIISFTQVVGLLLLVIVPPIISLKKDQFRKKFFISSIIFFALAGSLFSATSQILDKFSLFGISFLSAFIFVRLGTFVADVPIIYKTRKELKQVIKKKKIISLLVFSEILTLCGSLFFLKAVSLGNIALISSLTNVQPLMIIGLSLIFSRFSTSVAGEIEKQNLIKILIMLPFAILGVYLITA